MESHIIIVDQIHLAKNWAKDTIDNARKNNPNSFLFYRHEFKKKEEQIKSHIDSYTKKDMTLFFARKCIIKEIDLKVMRKFCNEYHIQGSNSLGIIAFGIFYDNDLLGVLSLGRHHRNKNDILLDRMCFKKNVRVIGGASKLFKHAINWASTNGINKIISFSDNRYSLGKVYEKMGFILEKELPPDYFYVDINNIENAFSKQSQKKQNVNCPNGFTEKKWAEKRGLVQVFDAGKKRWVYKIRKNIKNSFINRRQGFYETQKGIPKIIYYQSSYELRAATLLDEDHNVEFYTNQVTSKINDNERIIDFLVTYKNKKTSIIEVKPQRKLEKCIDQINDNKKIAKKNNWEFQLWTENELKFKSEHHAVKWADDFISKLPDQIDYVAIRKEKNKITSKKHYEKNIKNNTLNIFCNFCQKTHTALKITYERNIKRNSRYICEKEGGHISGSKPKLNLRKENSYANEGKKQCKKCEQIKLFEDFSPDKSRRDGYCSNCKICRAKRMKAAYEKKH